MKIKLIVIALIIGLSSLYSQNQDSVKKSGLKIKQKRETENNWSLNLSFSDNGFGFGATKYFNL